MDQGTNGVIYAVAAVGFCWLAAGLLHRRIKIAATAFTVVGAVFAAGAVLIPLQIRPIGAGAVASLGIWALLWMAYRWLEASKPG